MDYYSRYKELCKTYKVDWSVEAVDDSDVVIERLGSGHAHVKYRILKNDPKLPIQDLAILCDGGNLCFGYRTEGPTTIVVYTD